MLDCWQERKLGQETSCIVSFLSEKKNLMKKKIKN
jgi:hypothetical protein